MNFYDHFVTKRSIIILNTENFHWNAKNILKQEKNMFKLNLNKVLFNKVLTITWHCKDMVEPYYIKGVQKQPFADILQNRCSWKFCKIHRKTPVLESLFNKVAHMVSYYLCEIFKNTYFPITHRNQTTLLSKQISKVT